MCPDKKLSWISTRPGVTAARLKEIKKLVIKRWQDTYASKSADIPVAEKKKDNKVISDIYIIIIANIYIGEIEVGCSS